MGKREAENQLTQNNWEEQEDGGDGTPGAFKKADDGALAGRKIRGLPKRKGAAAPPAAAPVEAAPKPAPFSGFGAPAAASSNPFAALTPAPSSAATPAASPFSFGAAAPAAAKPATNGGFSFGSSSSASAFGSTPAFGAPSSSTPSAPSSSFSFGAAPSTTAFSAAPAASKPASNSPGKDAAHQYYTSLRALNLSLIDALTSEVDKDPFTDLSSTFDKLKSKYSEHRSKVQKEFDVAEGKTEVAKPVPAAAPAFEIPEIFRNPPKPVPIADLTPGAAEEDDGIPAIFKNPPKPVPIADLSETGEGAKDDIPDIFKNVPKPVPIADLTAKEDSKSAPPAPPTTFSFAGGVVKAPSTSSTSAPSAPSTGGFVFKSDAPADPYAEKSTFSFPTSTAPAKSEERSSFKPPAAPKLAPAKLTNPPAKPSPLRFGQSVSPPTSPAQKEGEAKKAAPGGFSFAGSFGSIAKGESEKKQEKVEEKKVEAKKPTFSFGGPSSTTAFPSTSSNPFGAPSSSTPAKSMFGAPPTPFSAPSGSNPLSAIKPASSPPITTSFGASSPPTFGFGAALQGKDKDKAVGASAGAARNTGFGFGSSIGSTGASTTGFSSGAKPAADNDKNQPAKVTTGFSFSATPSSSTPSAFSAAPAPAFSFGSSSISTPAPPAAASRTASVAPSDASEAAESTGTQTPGGNPFAAPGEGEEGETVLYTVRGKVWKLGGGQQDLLGVGNIALKEKEVDGKRKIRLLARNDTNGAVLINFSLHSAFSIKNEKVFATFTGFDAEAKPVIYRIRVKTAEMLAEFEGAVEEAKANLA